MKSSRPFAGCVALAAIILLAPCCAAELTSPAPAPADWPQWRGPNRDGVAPSGPKLLDAWPKEGPKQLWKSGWIPAGHAGGIGSPVVAEGKVFLYVSWRHPLDGGNDYCLINKKVLEEWGWLPDIPGDLAKKIEDARVSPTRPNVGSMSYSEFNWWDATTEQQDAKVEPFLKKYPQLEAGIKEFIATLSPQDAEKYGSYIKRRFCPNRKGQSRGRTWDELGKLNSQLLDKKYPTINPWYFGFQKYGMLDGDELSAALFATVERTTSMTDSVVCLDAATGKELWKKDFPVTAKDRPASFLGAAGTPAVWGGKCYFAGIMGLYCLSVKDGSLLWQVKGGGVNASVGVANGVVYGTVGGQPLSAYNPENGNVIWKSDPSAGSVNSSHVVWASGGKNYIIACGGGGTYCCIDIETGKVIWNIKCGNPGGTTPVISGDILVVQPDGCTQAYKMTPAKAELLWKKSISDHAAGPILYQDHVYLHTSYYAAPWWHCLDLMTGEEKWKQQSSIDSSCNCSSPIVADGKIFHTLGNGHAIENYNVEMLKPTPEKYVPLGVFNPEAAPLTSPTVAGGRLYLRLWDGLACYDLKENGVYLDSVNASKDALTFRFAQTGGELIAKDAAIGVVITDATGASKPARAKIEGDSIVVDIKDAAIPFGISYPGTDMLTGKNGLPLPAFSWNGARVLTYRKCFDNTIELASNLPLNQTWNTAAMYTVAGATVTNARSSGNGVILTTDKTWKTGDAINLTYTCFRVEQGDARRETLTFTVGDIQRAAAKFVKTDDTTAGTWKGVYGAQGAVLAGETARVSNCAVVTPKKNENHTFAGSTTDARAPQKSADTKDRIAACWFNNEKFDIEIELTDGKEHQVALYCLDWDGNDGRGFTVELQDTLTNAVLDTQTMKQYSKGKYLVWNLKGQVTLHFVSTGARNAVVSGVFIDPVQTVK